MHCRAGEESATVQVVVQLMAKQTGTVRQTPRAYKLQTGKIFHMDSLPLFLDADDEIKTLENLYASNPCHASPDIADSCICMHTAAYPARPFVRYQLSMPHAGR